MEEDRYPKTTEELEIGTIFVEHWCNFVTFYELLKTTQKSITIQKRNWTTDGDRNGDPTWRRAILKDGFEPYSRPVRKMIKPCKDGGFSVQGQHGGYMSIYNKDRDYNVYWG